MNKIRQFSTSVTRRINWSLNGTTENVTKHVIACDNAIENEPVLEKIRKKFNHASVEGNPHSTKSKLDGKVDPYHVQLNFSKAAAGGSSIGAHYYPETGLLRFRKGGIPDVILNEDQKAEVEALVLHDKKKGIPVVWQNGEWVRAAE